MGIISVDVYKFCNTGNFFLRKETQVIPMPAVFLPAISPRGYDFVRSKIIFNGGLSEAFVAQTVEELKLLMNGVSINDALVIYRWEQSNGGTDPNTGRVVASTMPIHLKVTYENVFFYDINLDETNAFTPYVPGDEDRQMGYFDETLYILSKVWPRIYVIKRAVGGTGLVPPSPEYPKSDFKNRCLAGRALVVAAEGEGNFDEYVDGGVGETDALTETSALGYEEAYALWKTEFNTFMGLPNLKWLQRRLSNQMEPDFPFTPIVQAAQDSLHAAGVIDFIYSSDNFGPNSKTDNSHFIVGPAVGVGAVHASCVLSAYGVDKQDTSKPVIQSAVVDATGLLLTLTYNKTLNSVAIPFALHYSSGTKIFNSITIVDNEVRLVPTVPFRVGDVATLSYTKNLYYAINVQDLQGNEADNFSGISIVNNSSLPVRTYTTIATWDFSGGADGFLPTAGCTLEAPSTVGGEANALKITATAGNVNCRDGTNPIVIGNTYKYSFWAYKSDVPLFGYDINNQLAVNINAPIQSVLIYDQLLPFGVWVALEREFTATGQDDIRHEGVYRVGDFSAIKNCVLQSVT